MNFSLEFRIIEDIENYQSLKKELNKPRTEEFRHDYNPLHVYCRLVDYYNYPEKLAWEYINKRYSDLYEN
jgi:hypothetical protein